MGGKPAGEEAYGEDPAREGTWLGHSWPGERRLGSSWKQAEPGSWEEDGVQWLGAVAKETWGGKLGFGALFSPWDQGFRPRCWSLGPRPWEGREPGWKEVGCGPEQGPGRGLWSLPLPGEAQPAEGWVPGRSAWTWAEGRALGAFPRGR